jgi:hypothetical protein
MEYAVFNFMDDNINLSDLNKNRHWGGLERSKHESETRIAKQKWRNQ